MSRTTNLRCERVQYIPQELEEGVLYLSEEFATAMHKCCCGCGNNVVTPIGPTDWQVVCEDGKVSLYPSIGNWSFPCRSHYWIRRGNIVWAPAMAPADIARGRKLDQIAKDRYFAKRARPWWKVILDWLLSKIAALLGR